MDDWQLTAFGEDIFEQKKGRGNLALFLLFGEGDQRVAFFAGA